MSPLDYGPNWVSPSTPGLPQARCAGRLCQGEDLPGKLVVAITLDEDGLCAQCRRIPASDDEFVLRLGIA